MQCDCDLALSFKASERLRLCSLGSDIKTCALVITVFSTLPCWKARSIVQVLNIMTPVWIYKEASYSTCPGGTKVFYPPTSTPPNLEGKKKRHRQDSDLVKSLLSPKQGRPPKSPSARTFHRVSALVLKESGLWSPLFIIRINYIGKQESSFIFSIKLIFI